MTVTVFVPDDSAARSVGADEVYRRLTEAAAGSAIPVRVARNGSRGMFWLEPFVEVEIGDGHRLGYGPVTEGDVGELVRAGLFAGAEHELGHGPVDDIDYLARQQRVTCARLGVIRPTELDDFVAHGGFAGLRAALDLDKAEVVKVIAESGLRGRGGAGFPTGIKWKTVLDAPAEPKFVCANADEGDSGTFVDRMLMEGDPYSLIEGMLIAAWAVGATEGYIYIRSEYPEAVRVLDTAIARAAEAGYLGRSICGREGFDFTLATRVGAGAYVCGEETSMLESLEGRRGMVRAKPPIPALEGLFGKPTIVNNVLTLASVGPILAGGSEAYAALGVGRSKGTQAFQLAGNVARGGLVEVPFGVSLSTLVSDFGGGTSSGRPIRAVQCGGPLGAYVPAAKLDLAMDYESAATAGAIVGHGGVVVFDDTVDMAAQARFAMEFCAAESCGKCTPCRIGSTRGVEVIDRIRAGTDRDANLMLLDELCETLTKGSLCAMGGLTPVPVQSALRHFAEDFERAPSCRGKINPSARGQL